MTFKKVLVTGGAGFIGSQLVRDLLGKEYGPYQVSVLDDLSTGSRQNLAECLGHPALTFTEGSINDAAAVKKALQGCDAVMHLAVSNLRKSIRQPLASDQVNAAGTLNVLEQSRHADIARFIYVSSSEIYGSAVQTPMAETHPLNPTTVYASSKLAGEFYALSYAKMYDLNCTVIRPFNNFGPRSHFERENGEIIPRTVVRLMNGLGPVIFGDGLQTRDFQYVTDTTRGLILALENTHVKGEVFNLACGQEVSVQKICTLLCELIWPSAPIEYINIQRPGDVRRHYADNRRFSEKFGFSPQISLEKGLNLYLEWFKLQRFDVKKLLAETDLVNW